MGSLLITLSSECLLSSSISFSLTRRRTSLPSNTRCSSEWFLPQGDSLLLATPTKEFMGFGALPRIQWTSLERSFPQPLSPFPSPTVVPRLLLPRQKRLSPSLKHPPSRRREVSTPSGL